MRNNRSKACIAGDGGHLAGKLGKVIDKSELTSGAIGADKPIVTKRGRPKTKPDSKAIIFHLPLDLIAQIDAEAQRITTSNKSAFAVKVFSDFFAEKTKNH